MDATLRKKEKYNGAERSLQCLSRFFGIVSSIACILPSRFISKVESFRLEVKKGDFVVFRFERERRVSTVKSSFLLITLSRKSDVKYEERYSPSLVFSIELIGNFLSARENISKPDSRATFCVVTKRGGAIRSRIRDAKRESLRNEWR